MSSIFGSFQQVFTFCFGALNTVWTAIGNVKYLFFGIFIMFCCYRFFIHPILGGNGIVTPSGWNTEQRPEPKERYQNTGIGFTARW